MRLTVPDILGLPPLAGQWCIDGKRSEAKEYSYIPSFLFAYFLKLMQQFLVISLSLITYYFILLLKGKLNKYIILIQVIRFRFRQWNDLSVKKSHNTNLSITARSLDEWCLNTDTTSKHFRRYFKLPELSTRWILFLFWTIWPSETIEAHVLNFINEVVKV